MKKKLQILSILLFVAFSLNAQTAFEWEKSQAQGTLPNWFSITHLERGLAYSPNNDRVIVASRNGGNMLYVIDAATGENVMDGENKKMLDVTDVSGGTYHMNDVEADDESAIFLCNLSLDPSSSPFKIYMWADENAAPVNIISYINADLAGHRFGDKFTVTGKVSDNSAKIHAVSSKGAVVEWTTNDQGDTWTPSVLFTVTESVGTSPDVNPIPGTTNFVCNGNGTAPIIVDNTGTTVKVLSSETFKTGTNALAVVVKDSKTYLITFSYVNEAVAEIYDITDLENASVVETTASLGTNSNGNGTGDVDIKDNGDGTYSVIVLGTNNGFGAAKILSGGTTAVNNFSTTNIRMYPNPVNDVLTIEGSDIKSVAITTIAGQEIENFAVMNSRTELNVQELSKGVYFVKVTKQNGKVFTDKFIKQ